MCQLGVCLAALLLGYSVARLAVSSVWPEWKTQKYAARFNASLSPLPPLSISFCLSHLSLVNCRRVKSSFKK